MAIKINIYNQKGEKKEGMELSPDIFDIDVNDTLVHQAMVSQMANQRKVLAHTKVRSEVRGGGRKPWRQKGTGRARAGSNRSPIWRGGGITFGPLKTRNFKKKINKKMRIKAMLMVLGGKVRSEEMIAVDKFDITDYKTKNMEQVLLDLESKVFKQKDVKKRSILLMEAKVNDLVKRSSNNLEGVAYTNLESINILDLLKYKNIVASKDVFEALEKRYKK